MALILTLKCDPCYEITWASDSDDLIMGVAIISEVRGTEMSIVKLVHTELLFACKNDRHAL